MATAEVVKSDAVVRVHEFRKHYRGRVAVDGLDVEIRSGELFGLIGPDGAGKSSLIKAIAGVLRFDGGSVEVFNVSLHTDAACDEVKDRIGFMPQGLGQNLYAELSVEENIDFFARLRLVPETALRQRKAELLAITRLEKFADRPMKQLSGGMKQKLGLVCTLIHEPRLVILDEPTTGVDPVSRRDFWDILARLLRERAITALVSTAYMDEANSFHRVGLMFGGRMLASGDPQELRTLARGSLVAVQTVDALPALSRIRQHFPQVDAVGTSVRVFVDQLPPAAAEAAVREVLPELSPESIIATEADLEDLFVSLLRQRGLVASSTGEPLEVPVRATGDSGPAIEAQDLTRDFGKFRAVDQVSFTVGDGEVFGLLGANGAGKSTVIKMLTGILQPSAGSGRVAGADMRSAGFAIKERIGYMSQAFSLYLDLTVEENIRLYAGIYGLDRDAVRQRMQWVIAMAELEGHEKERAARLPMGMRQRLALGCALVHQPRVLFLDEPTSGVDPIGRRAFWDMLFRLSRSSGVAILVTTHYMSEAEHCDRLALMYAGRIVAADTPAGMKASLERDIGVILEVTATPLQQALDILHQSGFPQATLFGAHLHCLSRQPESDRDRLLSLLNRAGLRNSTVIRQAPSMEDVFVQRVTALENAERQARKPS